MATENHPSWPKIAVGMAGAFLTGVLMKVMAVYALGIFSGRPALGPGIALGTAAAFSGMVSVGAAAIRDARNETAAAAKDYMRRAMLSAVTLRTVSAPALYGVKWLISQLLGRKKKTETHFLRDYDPIVVICYGITHLPNRFMLNVLKFCTLVKVSRKHRKKNTGLREKRLTQLQGFTTKGYIEAQPNWGQIPFGAAAMSYSGCEIMAVYNALHALGKEMTPPDMAELINTFERKGAVLSGMWGCSPYAVYDYFVMRGYETAFTCSRDLPLINQMGERFDAVILTAYNDRYDIRSMIHTICVTKDENGHYIMHNAYKKNKAGEYAAYGQGRQITSLQEIIKRMSAGGHASPVCVIGISNSK